jgi:hypothetical protein
MDGALNAVTGNEAKMPGITCNSLPPYTAHINAQFVLNYSTDIASCPRQVDISEISVSNSNLAYVKVELPAEPSLSVVY